MPFHQTGQAGGPTKYDYAQLERLWIDAGGPKSQASRAAATALAESGGNPWAAYPGKTIQPGTGTWNDATGLWQILGAPPGNWHPSQLTDPLENARMAVAKYNAAGWAPWAGDDWKAHYRRGVAPAKTVPGVGGGGIVPYSDPFAHAHITPERIDQGVDFSGTGPINAIGRGRVTAVVPGSTAGWEGGPFVAYQLSEGPAKGKYVYTAEGITPNVRVGEQVGPGTVIANFVPGSSIETGWASGVGTQPLSQTPQGGGISGAGPFPTKVGQSFDRLLVGTGVPASPEIDASTGSGNLPSWLQWTLHAFSPVTDVGAAKNAAGGLGGIAQSIGSVGDALGRIASAVDWFLLPSNEIRLLSGISGGILVVGGIWMMSHTGGTLPGAGENAVPRPMAMPLGIGMVGVGAILLFVALHNLPAGVNNFSDLIGHLTQSAQTGSYA